MAALESVPEAVDFLRSIPTYSDIFPDMDSEDLHRGTIERLLAGALYRDYARLYRFAGIKQRQFFKLYFMHFEIDILKSCLRNAAANQPVPVGLYRYEDFFRSHSKLNLAAIGTAATTDEFIESLEGTIYYPLLAGIRDSGDGVHLDVYKRQSVLTSFLMALLSSNILYGRSYQAKSECQCSHVTQ